MDKKIGNPATSNHSIARGLWLCLYTLATLGHEKQIRLSIYDMQRNSVKQVEVGVPFFLDVTTHRFEDAKQPTQFVGFEHFTLSPYHTQQTMLNINGKQSNQTTFSYIATSDKKGLFSVGPVTIKDKNGDIVVSEKLDITIGDTTIAPIQKHLQPYLLQTLIDSKSVYIGQKIKAVIRFCYKDEYDHLSFMDSVLNHFHRGFVSTSPEKGSVAIEGDEYKYEQINLELYPEKTGLLVIPAFQAVFVPAMRYQYGFSLQMQRAVQSSPRSIEVHALPVSKQYKDVSAIGTFDQITFSLQQTKATVGEGIVATMVIQGNGNLEIAKAPILQLPQGLRSYEGNSSVERLDHEKSRKKFEWIIQADSPGHYTIEPQTFSYFDIASQSYKTLKTVQSSLKITGDSSIPSKKEPAQMDLTHPKTIQAHVFKDGEIDYIHHANIPTNAQLTPSTSLVYRMLTWLIILLCILAILLIASLFFIRYFSTSMRNSFLISFLHYKYLFYMYDRRKDLQKLHQLFVSLGRQYDFDLHGEQLSQYFLQLKLPADSFQKWQKFMQMMLMVNFAGIHNNHKEREEVFTQAQHWFSVLLSCCKLQKRSYADKSVLS